MATFNPALYEASRRNIFDTFAQQAALNAYQRFLAETRGQRPILQLEEAAFATTPTGGLGEVPRLTSNYARRGLTGQNVSSGVYKNALESYARNRARQLGYATTDLAEQLRGFDLRSANLRQNMERGLSDLESIKARQISEDAQALLNLR